MKTSAKFSDHLEVSSDPRAGGVPTNNQKGRESGPFLL